MTTTRGQPAGRQGIWAVLALGLAFAACYEVDTTPRRLAPYYGEWSGPNATLKLTPGQMVYRNSEGVLKSAYIQSSFRGLAEHDIVYGGSKGRSRLRVDVPPHRVGKVWKMTVEGVELQRR